MTELAIEYSTDNSGGTFIKHQFATYPFHICRAQYLENDPKGMANVYIQSASGGIYENEKLVTSIVAHNNSYSHTTTQASTIVHSMTDGSAEQIINIDAEKQAYVEYFSDPLILFPDSKLSSSINIKIDKSSIVLFIDAFLVNTQLSTTNHFNWYNNSLTVFNESNDLLVKDVYHANKNNFLFKKYGYTAMGTLTLINRNGKIDIVLPALQKLFDQQDDVYGGATFLPNHSGVIAKFLAKDGDSLKKLMLTLWMLSRKLLVGIEPNIRRK